MRRRVSTPKSLAPAGHASPLLLLLGEAHILLFFFVLAPEFASGFIADSASLQRAEAASCDDGCDTDTGTCTPLARAKCDALPLALFFIPASATGAALLGGVGDLLRVLRLLAPGGVSFSLPSFGGAALPPLLLLFLVGGVLVTASSPSASSMSKSSKTLWRGREGVQGIS
jgi:hypothetical protein